MDVPQIRYRYAINWPVCVYVHVYKCTYVYVCVFVMGSNLTPGSSFFWLSRDLCVVLCLPIACKLRVGTRQYVRPLFSQRSHYSRSVKIKRVSGNMWTLLPDTYIHVLVHMYTCIYKYNERTSGNDRDRGIMLGLATTLWDYSGGAGAVLSYTYTQMVVSEWYL